MQCYKIVKTNQGNRETGVPDGTETFIAPHCLQIGIGHDSYLLIKEFASLTKKKSKRDTTCMERYHCNALHCSTRSWRQHNFQHDRWTLPFHFFVSLAHIHQLMIAANKHFHFTCKSLSLSLEGQQLLLPFHYCYLFLLFSFQGAAATPASLWQSQLHSFTRDNGLRLCGSGVRAFGGCHCHCNHYLCFLSSLFLCLWPASLCRFPQQQTAKVPIILPAPDSTLQCQSLR